MIFGTGFLCVVLTVMELTCRLGWPHTQRCAYLCLSSVVIKSMHHHAQHGAEGIALELQHRLETGEKEYLFFENLLLCVYSTKHSPSQLKHTS